MSATEASSYATARIEPADVASGFRCGKHPLDDYFARHALANDQAGIGRTYVLRKSPGDDESLPRAVGFYTLSMASVASHALAPALVESLPRYPMPVALIGRLAVDERARGRRIGERLLVDALRRVVDASELLGCLGIIVDAKDDDAERFYLKYDFAALQSEGWPRRMFLSIGTARSALWDP
jgi:GNAT superfamily N-acetyltransferase